MSLVDDLGRSPEAELVRRARGGDAMAFGSLYEEHVGVARRLARSMVADPSDADDVVAEVFAAVFAALRRGRGPADDFRAYVLRSIRRECHRTWRRGARQRCGGDEVVELATARADVGDDLAELVEGDVLRGAFDALAPRLRRVLWLTEVEGLSHDIVAAQLGTTSTNVAQLARRARLALGERYLAAHVSAGTESPACARQRRALVESVRGTASRRVARLAADHVASCPCCADAEAELQRVNERLRSSPLGGALSALSVGEPASLGLVARLVATLAGPLPTIAAAATLTVMATAVPTDAHRELSSTSPAVGAVEAVVPSTPAPAATPMRATSAPSPVSDAVPAAAIDPTATSPVTVVVPPTDVPATIVGAVEAPVLPAPVVVAVDEVTDVVGGVVAALPTPLPVEVSVDLVPDAPAISAEVGDIDVDLALPALPNLDLPDPVPLLGG